jgi:hypothetical protein
MPPQPVPLIRAHSNPKVQAMIDRMVGIRASVPTARAWSGRT